MSAAARLVARRAAAICLGLALTACGSDGGGETAASVTTERPTTSTEATTTSLATTTTVTTVATTTTTAPPRTTTTQPREPAPTSTAPPPERSWFDLGSLTCTTTGKTYLFYVRAFNGSIYAVDQQNQTYPYEISEQIGEWVHRDTYPQLDPRLPEYSPSTVEALRLKGEDYLCAAGD